MQESKYGRNFLIGLVVSVVLGSVVARGSGGQAQISQRGSSMAGLSSLPVGAQGTISARLGRDLPAYRIRRQTSAGLEAQNAKKTLTANFTAGGVTFHAAGATWGMALLGVGYGQDLKAVRSARPRKVGANRVEYRRGSYGHCSVTEWYVNGPLGVEQGFTIGKRPSDTIGQPLTIELGLSGNLAANVTPGSASLTLSNGTSKLRYAGLSARDASGTELPATLEVQGGRLLLKADDAGATYPVTIDPFVQLAELSATDGTSSDFLGSSIAVSGNTVVVGADGVDGYRGTVYIFVKPAGGWANMTETAQLTASDGVAFDELGYSVSISGNTVVAGAPAATVGGKPGQGAAYIFVKPIGGWANMTETAKLTASDGASDDLFGGAVSINSTTVVVGADAWNMAEGKAYVYVRPNGGWQTTSAFNAGLTASHGRTGGSVGLGVSVSGNTALVGSEQGVAYVFVMPVGGWIDMTETARLNATGGRFGMGGLGPAVSISGNTAVVGAPGMGQNESGLICVFVEPAGGWTNMSQTAELKASNGQPSDELGISVSISGNAIVAGSDQQLNGGPGKAYVFVEPAGGWKNMTQTAELTASDGASGAFFGWSVSLSGNTVVVGAPYATVNGNQFQGSAYVFGP